MTEMMTDVCFQVRRRPRRPLQVRDRAGEEGQAREGAEGVNGAADGGVPPGIDKQVCQEAFHVRRLRNWSTHKQYLKDLFLFSESWPTRST